MAESKSRRKLTFKKTETSRLKTTGAPPPEEAEETKASEAAVEAQPPVEQTAIVDPMALRDTHTSKVRKVDATRESSPLATAVTPGTVEPEKKTETVQLKVVQQKKKEIADMISPASTVRLRAPGKAAGLKPEPAAEPPPTAQETLKIKLPQMPVPTPTAPAAEDTAPPPPPAPAKTSTKTLKTVEAQAAEPAAEAGPAETIKVEPPAPGEEAPAAGGGAKRTLKLKGGKGGRTLKVKPQAGDAGEETVSLEAGEPVPGAPPLPAPQLAAARAAEPGVGFTIGAVITLIAVTALLGLLVMQFLAHLR
jgi:hypothetical protein